MRIRSERLVAAALVSLVCGVAEAQPAKAGQEEVEARAAFVEGSRFYDQGAYEQAIASFKRSYALSAAPALLLNIAQAYRLNGDCIQAAAFYRRFLEKRPSSEHRKEVESRIKEMDACGDAKSAPIVAPPEAPARPIETPPPPPRPREAAPPRETQATPSPWPIVAWSGVGLAVVGAGVGATSLVLALGRESDLGRACAADGGCPSSERDTLDARDTFRTIAIVGAVGTFVGVALAVVGFVRSGEVTRARALPRAWIATQGWGWSGTF